MPLELTLRCEARIDLAKAAFRWRSRHRGRGNAGSGCKHAQGGEAGRECEREAERVVGYLVAARLKQGILCMLDKDSSGSAAPFNWRTSRYNAIVDGGQEKLQTRRRLSATGLNGHPRHPGKQVCCLSWWHRQGELAMGERASETERGEEPRGAGERRV